MNPDVVKYEWMEEIRSGWTTEGVEDHTCSQPKCSRPAAAKFYRFFHRRGSSQRMLQKNWYCCDLTDHLYGRRLVEGKVQSSVMVGSPHWERLKEASNARQV